MSGEKWRDTEACEGIACPGDCDLCEYNNEEGDEDE